MLLRVYQRAFPTVFSMLRVFLYSAMWCGIETRISDPSQWKFLSHGLERSVFLCPTPRMVTNKTTRERSRPHFQYWDCFCTSQSAARSRRCGRSAVEIFRAMASHGAFCCSQMSCSSLISLPASLWDYVFNPAIISARCVIGSSIVDFFQPWPRTVRSLVLKWYYVKACC